MWSNGIRGVKAVALRGERVTFYGGYGEERDRLAHGELTGTSVEPTEVSVLTPPNGPALRRRRVVSRGTRIYVQAEPFISWGLFDLSS